MLSNIIARIKKYLVGNSEQENLDNFITQHQPTSVSDVEHWINVYDRNKQMSVLGNK